MNLLQNSSDLLGSFGQYILLNFEHCSFSRVFSVHKTLQKSHILEVSFLHLAFKGIGCVSSPEKMVGLFIKAAARSADA